MSPQATGTALRGISAASQKDVLQAVESVDPASAARLGAELFSVVGVLDGAAALRRVLTDPSTELEAKQGLAQSVLGGKVSEETITVVKVAARGRWAAGRDFVDGLETAGVAALVASVDAEGRLDELETELFEVGRTIASDGELRGVVSDRSIPREHKLTLLDRLFEGKVLPQTLELVRQAAAARTGSFERVLERFGETAAARRQRLVALVRVAYQLGDDEQQRLTSALAGKYGRDVHLNIVVDPSVVGGIVVSVGDEVVDGTMSSRLETARRRLAG
ncbi:F0F1 ATP synthase subunit delta [Aeromicrobium sp. CTD01-1L150]|uniref:F0F1 ATP synthase subunit delta n=1 Tax=Aeromicrobium sp. CTD01-1L150 TaxID=3341830 RepID=UPI0035C0DF0E